MLKHAVFSIFMFCVEEKKRGLGFHLGQRESWCYLFSSFAHDFVYELCDLLCDLFFGLAFGHVVGYFGRVVACGVDFLFSIEVKTNCPFVAPFVIGHVVCVEADCVFIGFNRSYPSIADIDSEVSSQVCHGIYGYLVSKFL